MSRRLYGFLTDIINENGALITSDSTSVALASVSVKDVVILFVPGMDVGIFSAKLPVRNDNEARHAAAYALEDEIAVAIEDTHFAIGSAGEDLQMPRQVHIIAKETMRVWTDYLSTMPMLAQAILVATPSVLRPGDVFETDGRVMANMADKIFSVEAAMPAKMLDVLLNGQQAQLVSRSELLQKLAERDEPLSELLDLRQGVFKAEKGKRLQSFKQWRLCGALACLLFIGWFAMNFLQTYGMNREAEMIDEEIREIYLELYPNAPVTNDYMRALTRATNDRISKTQTDFRSSSATLYNALEKLPGMELRSLSFDRARGGLIARISYADFGDDIVLKSVLGEAGVSASLGAARQEGNRVVGDVILGTEP